MRGRALAHELREHLLLTAAGLAGVAAVRDDDVQRPRERARELVAEARGRGGIELAGDDERGDAHRERAGQRRIGGAARPDAAGLDLLIDAVRAEERAGRLAPRRGGVETRDVLRAGDG